MKYRNLPRIVCCVCCLAMLAACGGMMGNGGNSGSNNGSFGGAQYGNNAKPPGGGRFDGDVLTEVDDAFMAYLRGSYHTHTTGTDSEGRNTTVDLFYAAPDKFDIHREVDGASKTEMMSIGQDNWIKMGDQPWKKSPVKIGAMREMQGEWLKKFNNRNSQVKEAGTETVDGVSTNVYEITYNIKDDDLDMTFKGKGKVWIGVEDKLPYKGEFESESTSGGKPSKMTSNYDHKTPVKIDPPM
jgi:hypothetical protein